MNTSTSEALTDAFKKCGEIKTALQVGKKVFAFTCIYCDMISMEFDNFVAHIEELHQPQLYILQLSEEDEVDGEQLLTELPSSAKKRKVVKRKKCSNIKEENFEEQIEDVHLTDTKADDLKTAPVFMQDPLDNPPINITDVKLEQFDEEYYDELPLANLATELKTCDDNVDVYINYSDDSDSDSDNKLLVERLLPQKNQTKAKKSKKKISKKTSGGNSDTDCSNNNKDLTKTDEDVDEDETRLTFVIIEEYQKHRSLWDEDHHYYMSRNKRRQGFEKLTTTVNNKLGLNMTLESIKNRIKEMRSKCQSDYKLLQKTKSKCKSHTPAWYYQKLSFLNANNEDEVVNSNSKCRPKKKAKVKLSLTLPNLTEMQSREFCEIVKNYPAVWHNENIGFRLKNQRIKNLNEILKIITNKFGITEEEMNSNIEQMRYICTEEKKHKLSCQSMQVEFKPLCQSYEYISFLEDHVPPYHCGICEKTTLGYDNFKMHQAMHCESTAFVCQICKKGFKHSTNFNIHLRRHTKDYSHKCAECGKEFHSSNELKVHMRSHSGERPYFCEICGKSCSTASFLKRHKRVHGGNQIREHSCTMCPKAYFTSDHLRNHMNVHLNIRNHICDVCNKTFTNKKLLANHKLIHAATKQYICKICNKDFAQWPGLNNHMKTHGTTLTANNYILIKKNKSN